MNLIEKRARELLAAAHENRARRILSRQRCELMDLETAERMDRAAIEAIITALTPPEAYVPERAMLRVATGLRERASRSARPLERKTLIASAEALE